MEYITRFMSIVPISPFACGPRVKNIVEWPDRLYGACLMSAARGKLLGYRGTAHNIYHTLYALCDGRVWAELMRLYLHAAWLTRKKLSVHLLRCSVEFCPHGYVWDEVCLQYHDCLIKSTIFTVGSERCDEGPRPGEQIKLGISISLKMHFSCNSAQSGGALFECDLPFLSWRFYQSGLWECKIFSHK